MDRFGRRLSAAAASLLLGLGIVSATAPTASAASGVITGNIQCGYGNNNVSGVWVNATNGTDGFASLTNDGIGGKNYRYTLSQSSSYRLHVGCGGTSQSWGGTFYSPTVNGQSYNWVCTVTGGQMVCALS